MRKAVKRMRKQGSAKIVRIKSSTTRTRRNEQTHAEWQQMICVMKEAFAKR